MVQLGRGGLAQGRDHHRRNHNKSYKVDEEYKNFFVFYEHDGEEVSTLLRLSEYDQFDKLSWVLLDEVPVEV